MRAIGYVRVSTVGQAEEGVSLSAQREFIRGYCKLHGLKLIEIIADEGLSAKNTTARAGAQRVLAMIESGAVDALVIYKLDRLARNTKDAIDIATLCRKRNVAFHSISEKLDTQSAMGEFFFTLMAAIAQLERQQIGERTRSALRHKRSTGEKTGGNVPFGFRARVGTRGGRRCKVLVPVPHEQEVLQLMRKLRQQGKTFRAICDRLAKQGIPTKQGRERWHPFTVQSLLSEDTHPSQTD